MEDKDITSESSSNDSEEQEQDQEPEMSGDDVDWNSTGEPMSNANFVSFQITVDAAAFRRMSGLRAGLTSERIGGRDGIGGASTDHQQPHARYRNASATEVRPLASTGILMLLAVP